jgi:hypothetical protein
MPQFEITCRAVFDEGVIGKLDAQGVYWFAGSVTPPESKRRRHHLKIESANLDGARERAREAIQEAGGDASDLMLFG